MPSSLLVPPTATAAVLEVNEKSALRRDMAKEAIGSRDPFMREAGAQLLAGDTDAEALTLLEKACGSFDNRAADGALRALLQSVATGSVEAEATLLRILGTDFRVADRLRKGETEQLGTIVTGSYDARRFQFLASHPQLARSRSKSIRNGTHEAVQANRSGRLRANPSFLAFFDVVRSDPDLRQSLLPLLSRRGEFVTKGKEPTTLEPFHRDARRMTGLLAAIGTDRSLAVLAQLVIDRSVRRETDALWQRLRTEVPFVPEVVIGSGPHAANFCATLATLRPGTLPLVVEQRGHIGGIFARPGGEAWRMNSRARTQSDDRRARPGERGALNSLGPYAPVQEGDLTGESYASQERLALATRLSLLLSCHAAVETTVVERLPNSRETREKLKLPPVAAGTDAARYLLKLQNVRTGETGYIVTDCVLCAGGLGEPRVAFGDRRSQSEIAQEKARGQKSRYLSLFGFMAKMADGSNPFPLRGLDTVIVVGGGDSARVAGEALLGYGPTSGKSVHTLDRVRQVIWIGQVSKTREAFLRCERPRYHALAGEFPRENSTSGNARIRPVAEKATLFRTDGSRAVAFTEGGSSYSGDVVVDCSGFKRDARGVPQALSGKRLLARSGSTIRVCDGEGNNALLITVQTVTPLEGDARRRNVEGVAQRVYGRTLAGVAAPFSTGYRLPEQLGEEIERQVKQGQNLPEGMILYRKETVLPLVQAMIRGEQTAIARQEANFDSVYFIGPQAGLPPKPGAEKMRDAALPLVLGTENQVALWRYAESVTTFAEYYFANLLQEREVAPLLNIRRERELPLTGGGVGETVITPVRDGRDREPVSGDSLRRLRFAVCEHLRAFTVPKEAQIEGDQMVRLSLVPLYAAENAGEARLVVGLATGSKPLGGVSLSPLLEEIGSDPLVQQIVFARGFPEIRRICAGRGEAIELTIGIQATRLRLLRLD